MMHKNSENWALEPDFKERFGRATSWMRQHITDNQQEDSSAWLVMHMGFQCAVQELASAELNEVVGTLRRIKQMDWPGVLADKSLECTELAFAQGFYSIRVAPSHFAVVGRDGNRMLILTLEHGLPSGGQPDAVSSPRRLIVDSPDDYITSIPPRNRRKPK